MTAKSENFKRKSILDVLRENLDLYERNIYVHRLIYAGNFVSNDLPSEDKELIEAVRKNVKLINDRYYDEKITGFLLLREQYFCCVLEGSEESIIRYLKLFYENEVLKPKLGVLKLLVICHNINQRFIDGWMTLTAVPNVNFDDNCNEADDLHKQNIQYCKKRCIEKLYQLGLSLRQTKIPEQPVSAGRTYSSRRKMISGSATRDPLVYVSVLLPRLDYIKFLVESSETMDWKKYIECFDKTAYLQNYADETWPVPCDYTPMYIFEKFQDPITCLENASMGLLK